MASSRSVWAAVAILSVALPALPSGAAAPSERHAASRPKPVDRELAGILGGFDRVQGAIRTLSAEFTETTENPLLKAPLVSRGRFYLTKPSSVMWEYAEPEPMRFVIVDDKYVGYFPERKRAERRDVRRWSEQIFRFFGLGQGSAELGKFYDIRLDAAGSDAKTHLLILRPKKRRVRRHVEEVKFWVSASTFLPVRLKYLGKDGYVRHIEFRGLQVNPDLSASLYRVDIPPDVTVTEGFTGLGGVRP